MELQSESVACWQSSSLIIGITVRCCTGSPSAPPETGKTDAVVMHIILNDSSKPKRVPHEFNRQLALLLLLCSCAWTRRCRWSYGDASAMRPACAGQVERLLRLASYHSQRRPDRDIDVLSLAVAPLGCHWLSLVVLPFCLFLFVLAMLSEEAPSLPPRLSKDIEHVGLLLFPLLLLLLLVLDCFCSTPAASIHQGG